MAKTVKTNSLVNYTGFEVTWTQRSQSTTNNRSVLRATVVQYTTGWSNSQIAATLKLTADGQTKDLNVPAWNFTGAGRKSLGYVEFTINHSSTGSKTANIGHSLTYAPFTQSDSGSFEFDDIARASKVTRFNNFDIGDDIPWELDVKSSSYRHNVRLRVGGTVLIEDLDKGSSGMLQISSVLRVAILEKLPENSRTVTAVLEVETVYNDKRIGSVQTKSAIATGKEEHLRPTIPQMTISEAGQGLSNTYTQNRTKLNVKTSAATRYGATINDYRVTLLGANYYGDDITTTTINEAGEIYIGVRVIDSRGIQRVQHSTITVHSYTDPKILTFDARRDDNNPKNLVGSYNFDIKSVNNKNSRVYRIRYRKMTPSQGGWVTLFNNTDSYGKSASYNANGVLDENSTYEVEFHVADYYQSATKTVTVGTAFSLVNYNASGKGLAFGGVSTLAEAFQMFMPMFDGDSNEFIAMDTNKNDYIRMANGIQICWGLVEINMAINGASAGIFRSDQVTTNFAKNFISIPTLIPMSNYYTSYGAYVNSVETGRFLWRAWHFISLPSGPIKLGWVAIGRWK